MAAHPPEPQRRCVGCGAGRPKRELVRLVAPGGALAIDRAQVLPGRGAYVCGADCLEQAASRGGLNRAFRRPVSAAPDTLESLRN